MFADVGLMNRPLEGVLVVAVEQAVAAPLCTARLAEAGARVIKIERKEGDFAREYDHVVHGESAYFVWLNQGKESIVLDYKLEEDAALLDAMVARADVFVQNLSPGAAERAGLRSDHLRARHPQLITCDISGYGSQGPARDMKAYDFLIQCETGLVSITGGVNEAGRVGISVADICCGSSAHAAVVLALYERQQTGIGSGISVSLFDGIAEWLTVPLLHQDYAGHAPVRYGLHHPSIVPYGAYCMKGGREIVLAVQNDREWRRFCEAVLERPELMSDPRFSSNSARCANRAELNSIILAHFCNQTAESVMRRLHKADIACASVNSIADLSRHNHLRRVLVETPTGAVSVPANPVRWSNGERPLRAVPSLDQNGPALRAEFAQSALAVRT